MNIKSYDFYYQIRILPYKINSYPWYDSYLDLGEALDQLKEMVDEPETEKSYVRDAAIHRFEFCIELFWKTLKRICEEEKYEVITPRDAIRRAFEFGIITDSPVWMSMLDDRNMTSHMYRKPVLVAIYYKIASYYKAMLEAYMRIGKRYDV